MLLGNSPSPLIFSKSGSAVTWSSPSVMERKKNVSDQLSCFVEDFVVQLEQQ